MARVATVEPRPPFDFAMALAYFRGSPSAILESVEGETLVRAVRLDGQPTLVSIRGVGTVTEPRLEVRTDAPGGAARLEEAVDFVRRTLRTDEDVGELEAIAARDAVFGQIVRRFRGLRLLQIPAAFETLIWAILGQQINVTFARKLKGALVECYGDRLRSGEREYRVFPEARTLAELEPADLTPLQFSRQKAEYVVRVARVCARGELDLESLADASSEAAIAELVKVRGVGRWTAEYTLMRGLGHRDLIPAADLGLRKVIAQHYGLAGTATEAQVRELAAGWAGWRSYAALYWWFALQERIPPETSPLPIGDG
ncbi:MAG: DNA-3-methyladenine glycosylase 2 family protein [Chloroflexi bacterium]|nr:DNA-3-methyladenine glycosylase 2 family protein [Chloroflexota bacterium]